MDWTYSFYIAVYFASHRTQAAESSGPLMPLQLTRPEAIESKLPTKLKSTYSNLKKRNDILGIRDRGDKLKDLAIMVHLFKNPLPLVYAVSCSKASGSRAPRTLPNVS